MRATLDTSSPQLGIILENTPSNKPHRPGDTIYGRVYRSTPGVSPAAAVRVTIYGLSKSKVQKSSGQNTHRYWSSFNCLSAPVATQVLLSSTPLHIPEGSAGESWPFAITIPPLVTDIRSPWQKKYFSAPSGAIATPFPPPGTFHFDGESFWRGEKCEAFIEYYVQARIELSHQHKGRTIVKFHTATAPFPLRNVNPGPPITDFSMKAYRRQNATIITYRLVPGVTELSFGQKTRQTLNSSKVPKLTFSVTLLLPYTLQVENRSIIPIILTVTPVSNNTSEIIHDVPQKMILKSFRIRVKPRISVQAERHNVSKSSSVVGLAPIGAVISLRQELSIPITPGAGAESTRLDIGEILGVRMPPYGLHPDFVTYNIVRKHELHWELNGSVAGEDFRMESWHSVRILPAAGELGGEELLPEYSRGKEAPPAYEG